MFSYFPEKLCNTSSINSIAAMQPERKASHRHERLDAGAAGRGCSTWRDTLFSAVVMVIAGAILMIGQESHRETPRTAVKLKVLQIRLMLPRSKPLYQ